MANRLINEQSPYLLQHAHNPVDWYPWGEEAFSLARSLQKPVLVSIGYAACHWCHVMEHESFEDEQIAAFMNAHFVCVKVDREEHPDVDHMYMDAVQAIGGSGGWPLNVFVTPDRAPFYGGTYYPPRPAYNRPSWPQLLQHIATLWTDKNDEVAAQAEQMIHFLQEASRKLTQTSQKDITEATCAQITANLMKMADKEFGGFGNAPKFPGTMAIGYLLEYYSYTGDTSALQQAVRSLDGMIEGGIYDQLGGGFARYATDKRWLAPHFEKMLYDNALLLATLCDAYSLTNNERYKEVIIETLAFADRELMDESGGYYCALDADSEGVEGLFYTWTFAEWQSIMGQDEVIAAQHWGVEPEGNWEHTNILHVAVSVAKVAANNGCTVAEAQQQIAKAKAKLLAQRANKVRPITDDKCLLSWNALMNIALTKAATTFYATDKGLSNKYLKRATEHMDWMTASFAEEGQWRHVWKRGVAKIAANLDDYAYLAQAMLQLASAGGDNKWLLQAANIAERVIAEFSRGDGFFYYSAAGKADIPVRKVDLYDGATPSANAVMAHNLWLCGMCMERSEWIGRANVMLINMADTAARYSYSFGYWAVLMQRQRKGMKTMVCSGSDNEESIGKIKAKFVPHIFHISLRKEIFEIPLLENKFFGSKMYIFVCSEQACLSPVSTVEEAFQLPGD
jgi:uncharacterized protein YyaL (SSP411 family)